jgi:nucleotide sugar dehydrogenase
VGGENRRATSKATEFYESLGVRVYQCKPEVAEASKLMENAYRAVNIAFVNEMWRLCEERGVDIQEVIEAALTKGFGFQAFRPGPGVGGHCIPEDPYYLVPRRDGVIQAALWLNETQPSWIVKEVIKRVAGGVKGRDILLIGASYKEDTLDTRNAPSMDIKEELYRLGAKVDVYDPVCLSNNLIKDMKEYDLIVILVDHSTVDLSFLEKYQYKVFDTVGALR